MFDPDVAAAAQDVDPAERIVRMADDRLVLLAPLERVEFEDDVAGEVGVVGPNAARAPVSAPAMTSKTVPGQV